MPLAQRAKQFAPFDALKGFKEAIQDVNDRMELTERIVLSEDQQNQLDDLVHELRKGDRITITYYHKGRYIKLSGVFIRINDAFMTITVSGKDFSVKDILEIRPE